MRTAKITRKTSETDINLTITIDGSGKCQIQTGIPFLDHMLTLFAVHGHFDLELVSVGDIDVDYHHSVEDIGICLGKAVKSALGDCKGIRRFASGLIPMDEALCQIAIDVCNRPTLVCQTHLPKSKVGTFDTELVEEFLNAFVNNVSIALHIDILRGDNMHHVIESIFKGLGVTLRDAIEIKGHHIPSTKGML